MDPAGGGAGAPRRHPPIAPPLASSPAEGYVRHLLPRPADPPAFPPPADFRPSPTAARSESRVLALHHERSALQMFPFGASQSRPHDQQQQQQQQQQHQQRQQQQQQQHMPVPIAAAPDPMSLQTGASAPFDASAPFANNSFLANMSGNVGVIHASQHIRPAEQAVHPREAMLQDVNAPRVQGGQRPPGASMQNQTSRDFFGELEKALAGDSTPSHNPAHAGFELLDDALAMGAQPTPQQSAMAGQAGASSQLPQTVMPHSLQQWQHQSQRNAHLQPGSLLPHFEQQQQQQMRNQQSQQMHVAQQQRLRDQQLQQQHLQNPRIQEQLRQQQLHHQAQVNTPRGSSILGQMQSQQPQAAIHLPHQPAHHIPQTQQLGARNFQQMPQGQASVPAAHPHHPVNITYAAQGYAGKQNVQNPGQSQRGSIGQSGSSPSISHSEGLPGVGHQAVSPPQMKPKTKSGRKQSQRRPRAKAQAKNLQPKISQPPHPSPPKNQTLAASQQFTQISQQQLHGNSLHTVPQQSASHVNRRPSQQLQHSSSNSVRHSSHLQPAPGTQNVAYQQGVGMQQLPQSGAQGTFGAGVAFSTALHSGRGQALPSHLSGTGNAQQFMQHSAMQGMDPAGVSHLQPSHLQPAGRFDPAALQNLLSKTTDPKVFAVLKQQLDLIRGAGSVSAQGSAQNRVPINHHGGSVVQGSNVEAGQVGAPRQTQQISVSDVNATSQGVLLRNQQLRQQQLYSSGHRQLQHLQPQPRTQGAQHQGEAVNPRIFSEGVQSHEQVAPQPQNLLNPHANRSVASLPPHIRHQIQAQIQAQHIQAQLQGQGQSQGRAQMLGSREGAGAATNASNIGVHAAAAVPTSRLGIGDRRKPKRSPRASKRGGGDLSGGLSQPQHNAVETQQNLLKPPQLAHPPNTSSSLGAPLASQPQTRELSDQTRQERRNVKGVEVSSVSLLQSDDAQRVEESKSVDAERKRLAKEMDLREIADQKRKRLDIAPGNDYQGVLAPDYKTPFRGQVNAWQRLLPFHVTLSKDGESVSADEWDSNITKLSSRYRKWFTEIKRRHAGLVYGKQESVYDSADMDTSLNDDDCVTMENVLLEDFYRSAQQDAEAASRKASDRAAERAAELQARQTAERTAVAVAAARQAAAQGLNGRASGSPSAFHLARDSNLHTSSFGDATNALESGGTHGDVNAFRRSPPTSKVDIFRQDAPPMIDTRLAADRNSYTGYATGHPVRHSQSVLMSSVQNNGVDTSQGFNEVHEVTGGAPSNCKAAYQQPGVDRLGRIGLSSGVAASRGIGRPTSVNFNNAAAQAQILHQGQMQAQELTLLAPHGSSSSPMDGPASSDRLDASHVQEGGVQKPGQREGPLPSSGAASWYVNRRATGRSVISGGLSSKSGPAGAVYGGNAPVNGVSSQISHENATLQAKTALGENDRHLPDYPGGDPARNRLVPEASIHADGKGTPDNHWGPQVAANDGARISSPKIGQSDLSAQGGGSNLAARLGLTSNLPQLGPTHMHPGAEQQEMPSGSGLDVSSALHIEPSAPTLTHPYEANSARPGPPSLHAASGSNAAEDVRQRSKDSMAHAPGTGGEVDPNEKNRGGMGMGSLLNAEGN